MNPNVLKLYETAQKSSRVILGLMSGTSRDGLDLVLCRFFSSGLETSFVIEEFASHAYPEKLQIEIEQVFAKQTIDFQQLTLLHADLGIWYGNIIRTQLKKWKIQTGDVDLIASHGQTVYHAPIHFHGIEGKPNATLQIGDADHIAKITGIITLSDFRQKHIAAGGEGAPLAVYGDGLLFRSKEEDRILLNIGGISNYTYLPKSGTKNIFTTDCGPGNTLMDWAANTYFNAKFDDSGKIASSGKIHAEFMKCLKNHAFFKKSIPRSTGPEEFNALYVVQCLDGLSVEPADIICTLTEFTVWVIVNALKMGGVPKSKTTKLYVSGGGEKNDYLLKRLQEKLKSVPVHSFRDLGVEPQAKEGLIFAALANESVASSKTIGNKSANIPEVFMGKVSFPT